MQDVIIIAAQKYRDRQDPCPVRKDAQRLGTKTYQVNILWWLTARWTISSSALRCYSRLQNSTTRLLSNSQPLVVNISRYKSVDEQLHSIPQQSRPLTTLHQSHYMNSDNHHGKAG